MYMFTKELQLQFLLNASLYIRTSVYTYIHSLVLECALEIPKCACRNAPLPMIGLIKHDSNQINDQTMP